MRLPCLINGALVKSRGFLLFLVVIDFFKKIVEYFDRYEVPYMLSGSIAMGVYTISRATKDLDFVVHLQLHHVESFKKRNKGKALLHYQFGCRCRENREDCTFALGH